MVVEGEMKRPDSWNLEQAKRAFMEGINDNILFQYFRDIVLKQGEKGIVLQNVEDVLGHRLLWSALMVSGTAQFDSEVRPKGLWDAKSELSASSEDEMKLFLADEILQAIPYLWKKELWELATEGDLPKHVISDHLLPFDKVWFAFEKRCLVVKSLGDDTEDEVSAIYLDSSARIEDKPGLAVTLLTFRKGDDGRLIKPKIITNVILYGTTYPDDVPKNDLLTVGHFLKLFSFLNSSNVEARDSAIDSKRRYWIEKSTRKTYAAMDGVVKFVDLRKKHDHKPTESHTVVNWKNRWLVKGHHRAQWYPSRQSHDVKWIAAYVKGPDDKPIKTPIYRVIR